MLTLGPLAMASAYSFAWGRYLDLEKGEETVRVSHRRLGITLLAGGIVYGIGLLARLGYLSSGAAVAVSAPGAPGGAAVGGDTLTSALLVGQQVVGQNGPLLGLEAALGIGVPTALALLLWPARGQPAALQRADRGWAGADAGGQPGGPGALLPERAAMVLAGGSGVDTKRRRTILALLMGSLAGMALVAVRKGVPGARGLARRLAKPREPQAEMYGYREVKLS